MYYTTYVLYYMYILYNEKTKYKKLFHKDVGMAIPKN